MNNIIITKYADDDYSICVTDDIFDVNGCSVRAIASYEELELMSTSLKSCYIKHRRMLKNEKMIFGYVETSAAGFG